MFAFPQRPARESPFIAVEFFLIPDSRRARLPE
jgi:hypothetical protein